MHYVLLQRAEKKAFVHMPLLPNLDLHKSGEGVSMLLSNPKRDSEENVLNTLITTTLWQV